MTVSGKDKRGLVEELRTLRTRLDRLERRNAELVQVEQKLRESLEQFKTSFDDSPVGLYRTTPDGQILMANSAVVTMLGCSSYDELARRNLEKEGYEPEYPRSDFKERIKHEGKVIGLESAWKRSDGTTLYVRESAQAVCDESGRILYYQGTVEDITERKQAEEALRKAHDELEMRVLERTAELQQANEALQAEIAERVKAEEELRVSENRYRTVIEHAGESIVVIQDGMLRFVNPQATGVADYSEKELTSRPFIEFVHPDDRERVMDIHTRRLQGQEVPFVYEFRTVDKQGNTKWMENNGVLIAWKGRPATLNFSRDITDRKKAEETLRETTGLLETIFAHTHILVAYLDSQFNFVRVNRAYAEADGRDVSFYPGRNHFDSYPSAANEAIFRKVVEIGVPYFAHAKPLEYAEHPERGVSYWDWSLVPIKQQDGVVSGLVLTLVNVTEQKRAEQALQESEHRYHAIFEQAADSIVLIDPETAELVEFNDRAYENLGYSREEFAKLKIADLNVVESAEEVLEHAEKVVTQGSDGFETKKRCRSGEIRDIQVSARSIALGGKNYIQSIWHDITDRKRAEEALYEREATLTNIFRAAPVGIGLECDRVLSRVNDTICEMLGYSREELVGQRANMFYPSEEDYQRIRGEKRRQILQKGTATVETRWKRKDGRIIDVLLSTIALDPADFSKGVTFTALDITERKRAEQAMRESEEKFRSLAEQSPNMIFINKEGRVIYANKRCEEVMGYTREQLYSPDFDFLTMIAPESLDVIRENYARHLRGEEVEPYDYCLINKQGERIEAINASKLIHYEGETAILGIVTDITERKRAERELCESQERLKILFESAPDAIYLTDLEGRFVDGNRAAEELVGFAKAELIGKSLAESGLLSAEQLLLAAANLRKVAASKPSGPTEYAIRRKDGSLIAIEVRTFPVRILDQVLSLGIARDVTARRQAQQRLLDDREQLKSLASQLSLTEERERHRLATELHDQIGQSLVISKIKLDQLAKDESCGDLAKALHDVSVCLGQVISDTRSLTFDLSYPILYELGFEAAVAEWLMEHVQEEHGIETDFEDDGQSKPLDDDIRALLFRNVRELLINVVKHARARRVKVAVRRVEDQILTRVEDDGVGFDPVEVTAMAAKRAEFGLFSIRERLEQLGGLFEVVSAPGRGTRITMTAPLKYRKKEG